MNPILSICVLTYNRPNFLIELLNSIFTLDKSSLDQIEIIVIDNGSTDETWQILDKYSSHRNFVSERFSENLRGSASYLELIKRVNGDFIIFPGDDDVFKPSTLSKAIKFLSEFGEKYSLIAFGADTINEYGKSNLFSYSPPSKYSRDQIAAKLLVDSVFWMPCTIVKTNVVKDKNDPLTITAFDWWIWISGIIKGEIKFFESDLISYRQHDGQEQKSFLKLNWEVDSLLMLSRELESDFGKYIRDLLENNTNFLGQLKIELGNIKIDEFQIIKWSSILTKISTLSHSINLLKHIGNPARIWNDLRFVESWFQQKLSTEEILSFFESWGVDVVKSTLSEGEIYLEELNALELTYENTPKLRLYYETDSKNFQFILLFQKNNEILEFKGSTENTLRSNLKTIFGMAVKEYREVEVFNQITPFEAKVLGIVRKLKGNKFSNLLKSQR